MKIPDENRATFDLPVVAKNLGISRAAAYRAAHAGQIPVIKLGRRMVVPRTAYEALLASGSLCMTQKTGAR